MRSPFRGCFLFLARFGCVALFTACGPQGAGPSASSADAVAPGTFRDYVLPDPAALAQSAAPGTWLFRQSEITGGGLAMGLAVDPYQSGFVAVGGDSWGLYNSRNAGNQWLPAMIGTPQAPMTGLDGTFYYSGMAYSKKARGVLYGLTGRIGGTGGGFIVVDGYTVRSFNPAVQGSEPALDRHQHPRPNGHRLLVDLDASTGVESIYVAGGNGTGVFRSTDQGVSFQSIGLASVLSPTNPITGMAIDPQNRDNLVVATRSTQVYILKNIRDASTSVTVQAVSIAPHQFEELASVNGVLWAAGRRDGLFKSTDGGLSWASVGSIPATVDLVAVGGRGTSIFAGCVADGATPHCIYRSLDGGATFSPVADSPSVIEWGSNRTWWHGADSGALINGSGFVTSQIALDAQNPSIVYVAGRAGVWKSEDAGNTWRPAVVGLGGSMNQHFNFDGTYLQVSDTDFTCFKTTAADAYQTPIETKACSFSRAPSLKAQVGTDRIEVVPPTSSGVPAKFLVNGVDQADDTFRSGIAKPIDTYSLGGILYIAQDGGGVVLARRK